MTKEILKLRWLHDTPGEPVCLAEPGQSIRSLLDSDPYNAGLVTKIEETEFGALVHTKDRPQPIAIFRDKIVEQS